MKTLTHIACLFSVMLFAASTHAQHSSWRNEREITNIPLLFPGIEETPLQSTSKTPPFGVRDYLLRWLNPAKSFDELTPKVMPFPERMRRLNIKMFFPHPNNYPRSEETLGFAGDVQAAWANEYASHLLDGDAFPTAMVTDGAGNVYVTGYCEHHPYGLDYFTLKYDGSGTQVWTARYNGPGNGDDLASAINVDSLGDIYVTGTSWTGISFDYVTIKYNSAGVQQWIISYNGSGNADDEAIALALDGMGNIYVTGASFTLGSGESWNYLTIKYNSAGTEQWVARYNGPNGDEDVAIALAIDASGNVYVTGYSSVSNTKRDYATVKYNSAGVQQWVARYNGPGNAIDGATAIAVDDSGNICVTGYSYNLDTSSDYATVKYNSAGVQQWVARYNGPGNAMDEATVIAVDGSGNVCVTGYSYGLDTSSDYTTIKYNSAGVQLWVARYDGPGETYNKKDVATTLIIDGSGNVYVAGWSSVGYFYTDYATIKYNPAGAQLWVARYNGPGNSWDDATALAVDGAGNVYVAGHSEYSNVTVKYTSLGIQQWSARTDGPGNSKDTAKAIAVDGSGNTYVVGSSYVNKGRDRTDIDYFIIKYNSVGVVQWVAFYNGLDNYHDEAAAIAVDDSGNVYVTGGSGGSYATVKYNSAGVQQWVARYNEPGGNESDAATALIIDGSGNLYVTGLGRNIYEQPDYYVTIKYNSAGTEQWIARYHGAAADQKMPTLAIDDAGNVYVAGTSLTTSGFDYVTVKYNSVGIQQWVVFYSGPGNHADEATAIAVDDSGYVYVTGESYGSGSFTDYATIKYNPAGAQLWVARYNGPGHSSDLATDLAVDGHGNVYVTGGSPRRPGGDLGAVMSKDYATVKYNSAGAQLWVARYNGPQDNADEATSLVVDGSGNVYVTGYSSPDYGDTDYATVKYNESGVQQWAARYHGPGAYNTARALAIDDAENVYVTGYSRDPRGGAMSICTTIKYVQTTVSVKDKKERVPSAYRLDQNYPNPFNPSTTIRYSIGKPGHVTLKVFNLQGQEIETLVSETKPAGEYEIHWNPTDVSSGVYFYRLQADKFAKTRKFILIK